MNVFVLTTGRTGSTTFARACSHLTNFTAGHESRAHLVGPERLAYPAHHIEIDNRLVWFLGRLEARYGNEAHYVHLARDRAAGVDSFLKRWPAEGRVGSGGLAALRHLAVTSRRARRARLELARNQLVPAFAHAITIRKALYSDAERRPTVEWLLDTIDANINAFLRDKQRVLAMRLETISDDFPRFLEWIGAEGDLERATAEWQVQHNASAPSQP